MNSFSEWLNQNTHLLYLPFFVNGLALFSVALVTGLESRRAGKGLFARSLWLLSIAPLLISVASWAQMASLIGGGQGLDPSGFLLTSKVVSISAGSVFLLRFGTVLGEESWPRSRGRLRWLPVLLLCIWLIAMLISFSRSSGGTDAWLEGGETLTRRLLYFPALILAGLALCQYRPGVTTRDLAVRLARARAGAGAAFGFKAIVAGLVSTGTAGASGTALGQLSSQAGKVFLVEPLRTIATIAIAYFVVRMLYYLEDERRRQLDAATERHLQAERAAMEAEQFSRETVEQLSFHLGVVANTMVDAIREPHKLQVSLEQTLSHLFAWTGFDAGQVLLKDLGGNHLVQVAQRCACPSKCCTGCSISEEQLSKLTWSHPTVRYLDQASELARHSPGAPELQTVLTIPIKCIDDVLGIVALGSLRWVEVSSSQLGLMEFVGQQIGSAVEHLRVHEELSSAAARKERVRLSRDIHDSVAQELDLLYLRLTTLEELVQVGDMKGATSASRRAVESCSVACDEARQAILDLRFAGCSGSLVAELKRYAGRLNKQSKIAVEVHVGRMDGLTLPHETEVQLLGIIQEALSNIRRHAGAKQVRVDLAHAEGIITLTIVDDGRGFDKESIEQDGQVHFGLTTMRERAESVGGSFEVHSEPGGGTRLVVSVPALV